MMPINDMQQQSITTRERIVKAVGRCMLAWAALGMPLVTFSSYAQGLPDQLPTTQQRDTAVQLRTDDTATSDSLINRRASKLLSGRYNDDVPVRGPRIQADDVPVRDVKILPDPDGEAQAQRQAERAGKRTVSTPQRHRAYATRGHEYGLSVPPSATRARRPPATRA